MRNKGLKELVLFSLAFVLLAGVARAQTADVLTADIPFSFTVEKTTLPAGPYTVYQVTDQPLEWYITDAKGMVKVLFSTETAETAKRLGNYELVFNFIGGKYFLSSLWLAGEQDGYALIKSSLEKSLLKGGEPKTHRIPLKKKKM
jgi:hypothetical protein